MILYAVAAEQSLGRLFLAAIGPALLLVGLFAGYAMWRSDASTTPRTGFRGNRQAIRTAAPGRHDRARQICAAASRHSVRDLLTGVMVALYGGFAKPSETAGLGAVLALILIAAIYNVWRPRELEPILVSTLKESTMLMFIIGMSLLYSYVMSYLHISQSTAEWIVSLHSVALGAVVRDPTDGGGSRILSPAVSIILMTAPIILPPLRPRNSTSSGSA